MIDGTKLRTEADAISELATRAASIEELDVSAVSGVVLAPGHQYHVADLERFLAQPRRTHATVRLHTAASLADYVNRHKDPVATTLYASAEIGVVQAVLNDSAAGAPGWGDHRGVLELKPTDAWRRWAARDGGLMGQHDFAEHIEAGLAEIVSPPAADMLELAQTFETTKEVAFKSASRIRDGQRALVYEETVEARAGQKGTIEIPTEFTLGIAPYEGSEVAAVTARLRYRINGVTLAIGYVLVRPTDILRAAFVEAVEVIEAATELKAFWGMPPVRG